MNRRANPTDADPLITPLDPDGQPEPGYDRAVQREITLAESAITEGKAIPHAKFWKKFYARHKIE